jgi:hypothetical protein
MLSVSEITNLLRNENYVYYVDECECCVIFIDKRFDSYDEEYEEIVVSYETVKQIEEEMI